jgi:hypothetical protein
MGRAFLVVLLSGLGLGVPSAVAQEADTLLPVTGSLIYNAIIYNRLHGTHSRGAAVRFAGRVAARVAGDTYIGVGGGSWVRVAGPSCGDVPGCREFITVQSEAVVYQLYVQRYVSQRLLFLRAGLGLANTTTILPENGSLLKITRRWRAAISAGTGIDLRMASFLYLTPSLDLTVLPGTDTRAQELRSGFAVGLALTLR